MLTATVVQCCIACIEHEETESWLPEGNRKEIKCCLWVRHFAEHIALNYPIMPTTTLQGRCPATLPVLQKRNWGLERWADMRKVTQRWSNGARIGGNVYLIPKPLSLVLQHRTYQKLMKRKDHRLWVEGVFVAVVMGESIKTGSYKIALRTNLIGPFHISCGWCFPFSLPFSPAS